MRKIIRFVRNHNMAIKALNLVVLLVVEFWLVTSISWEPSLNIEWEPVAAFLTALGTLVFAETTGVIDQKREETDRQLLDMFLQDLPSSGNTITFLRNQHMGDSFDAEFLGILSSFVERWDDVEREFHDEEIE